MRLAVVLLWVVACVGAGCGSSRKNFSPQQKYSPQQLQQDYTLFRNILEDTHPSLYWYTTKDSLDYYFNQGYARLTDSMGEMQFRALLSYVISKIHCGHTATKYSKNFSRYLDTAKLKMFPLSFKFLDDTAMVNINLNRRDSILRRGTVVTSINNVPVKMMADSLEQYLPTDGYNETSRKQTLSNTFVFAGWYRNVFGLQPDFLIGYLDSNNIEKQYQAPIYDISRDTVARRFPPVPMHQPTKRERRKNDLFNTRYIEIDTSLSTAYMQLNSFSGGNKLKPFFRRAFKTIRKEKIQNLVIDVRNNGGGNVVNSTYLTQLLIDKDFKLADSLYAIRKSSRYGKYMQYHLFVWPFMSIVARKQKDGFYHRRYFEKHVFKPKKKNHYNGQVYVITGGNSFSATSLFAQTVKGQKNIMLVGEETGGGSYGNTSWYVPDVTLPITGVRFSLPRFRHVINKDSPKTGLGVMPDVTVTHTLSALRKGIDLKVEYVRQLITKKRQL